MHHQCKRFKPLPLLHPLHWDRCLHNKTIPTSRPPIINKGNLGITNLGTKATINRREVVNNQTLPTMPRKSGQSKILSNQMHLYAMLRCAQTSHASCVRSIGTIHMNAPSWVMPSKPFTTRFSMLPIRKPKVNPTQHHQGLHPWSSKTHYQSKEW